MGNANKWMTPHHQAKQLDLLKPGDRGIWVTCHRHKEDRALKEISTLFSEVSKFGVFFGGAGFAFRCCGPS